jgi:hypothetical protein
MFVTILKVCFVKQSTQAAINCQVWGMACRLTMPILHLQQSSIFMPAQQYRTKALQHAGQPDRGNHGSL